MQLWRDNMHSNSHEKHPATIDAQIVSRASRQRSIEFSTRAPGTLFNLRMHIYKVANDSLLRTYVAIYPSICVSISIVSDVALFHCRLENRQWLPRQFGSRHSDWRCRVMRNVFFFYIDYMQIATCTENACVLWKFHNGKSRIQRSPVNAVGHGVVN